MSDKGGDNHGKEANQEKSEEKSVLELAHEAFARHKGTVNRQRSAAVERGLIRNGFVNHASENSKAFYENFDRIFGAKNDSDKR